MKHWKILVKCFACVSTKSLNFEMYFLSFPWEISFWCYYVFSFKEIFTITLVQIFVRPLKPEIARSSIGFRLNSFNVTGISW